jgi:hypothetical protein
MVIAWLQTVDVVVSVLAGNVLSLLLPIALYNMYFLLVPKRNLKTMLRYPYLFSLPYKLIRDVLKRV